MVQIGDGIIWYSKVKPNKLNIFGTNIVYFGLLIQAFSVGFTIYKNEKNTKLYNLSIIITLYYLLQINSKPSKIVNNNLVLGFDDSFYVIIYIITFYISFHFKLNINYKIFIFLWFSFLGYYFILYKKYKGASSLWCYNSSILTPLLYFFPYFIN